MQEVARRGKALREELDGVQAELDEALASLPNPPDPTAADEDTVLYERGEAGRERQGPPRARRALDRHGGGSARGRLALRLPQGRPRAARARARALGARAAARQGLRAGRPARAGARGGAARHRLPARHRAADLPPGRRRALPDGHQRGGARLAARGRDRRRRAAAAALRRLLALLPARGGRRRARHARAVPRAPVRQGRDVLVRRAPRRRSTSTSGCSPTRRRS